MPGSHSACIHLAAVSLAQSKPMKRVSRFSARTGQMNTLGKSLIISAAAAAMTFASLSAASADAGWHHHHDNSGWVAGAAGLATGLVVGSVIANQPRYVEPDPYYDAPPPP